MLKIQLKLYIFYQFYLFYKNLSNYLNQMQIHTFLKHEIIPVFPVFMTPIATPCQIMIIGPDYIKKWCWILCSAPFFIKPVNIIFQKNCSYFLLRPSLPLKSSYPKSVRRSMVLSPCLSHISGKGIPLKVLFLQVV